MPPVTVPTTAEVLGLAGIAIALVVSFPQLLRILREGSVAGVSVAAVANAAVSQVAWTGYAAWLGDGWLLTASAVGLPGILLTAWVAWRSSRRVADLALPSLWAGTLVVTATGEAVGAWTALGVVVGGSIAWLVLPAAIEAWRSRDVRAISPQTWWLLALEAVVACLYGLETSTTAATVFGLVELVGAVAVLTRVHLAPPRPANRGRHAARPQDRLRRPRLLPQREAVALAFADAD